MAIDQDKNMHGPIEVRQQRSGGFKRRLGMLLIATVLFGSGVLIGSGRVKVTGVSKLENIATNGSADAVSTEGLQEIYDKLKKNYDGDVTKETLLDGLKKGAVASVGDPYTVYMSPDEAKEFNSDLDGKFEGIGAELSQEEGLIVIVSPIKGAPAEKAGLQPRDIVVEIDGESSTEMTVSEAVKRIRGEKGTEVKLGIVREGEKLEFTIKRDTIDIASVEWTSDNGTGVITISRFSSDTTDLVRKAAQEFNDKGITKVILDMRGNPGGLLDQAVGVSEVWLEKGSTVLDEKRGDEVIQSFKTEKAPIFKDVKTIVLINEGSASASEIVAGALKDNNKATLMGEKSFGKGSVQQLLELSNGGALKVTIARWYTPGGKNIDKEGISPDNEIARTVDDIKAKRDPQLDAAKAGF